MNSVKYQVIKSPYGYFSIEPMPTSNELEQYYSNKYFQSNSGNYQKSYTSDEVIYFTNQAKTSLWVLDKYIDSSSTKKLIDIGSGEGFFASEFYKNNWDVTLLDYSDYGLRNQNSHLLEKFIQGDIYYSLDNLIKKEETFMFVNMTNVLEHVIDPIKLLEKTKKLLTNKSILRITVPNDYSTFQEFLLDKNYTENTWLCFPDHLHYFSQTSLYKLLVSLGYDVLLTMGEFPIEIFIANESSNYAKNRLYGKSAHKARIEIDNFLFSQGIDKYIDYYQASLNIGLSRQIVVYAIKRVD